MTVEGTTRLDPDERWHLADERTSCAARSRTRAREHAAGDLSDEDYALLVARDSARLVQVQAELAQATSVSATTGELDPPPASRHGTDERLATCRTHGAVAPGRRSWPPASDRRGRRRAAGRPLRPGQTARPVVVGQRHLAAGPADRAAVSEAPRSTTQRINERRRWSSTTRSWRRIRRTRPRSGRRRLDPVEPGVVPQHVPALAEDGRAEVEKAVTVVTHLLPGPPLLRPDPGQPGPRRQLAAVAQFDEFLADDPPTSELAEVAPLVAPPTVGDRQAAAGGVRHRFVVHVPDDDVNPVGERGSSPTTAWNASANAGPSASVVVHPTLTRSEWLGSAPMASSTGRGLDRLRRARRPGVHRHARAVEPDQHRLGLHAVDAQADEVGQAIRRVGCAHRPRRRRRTAHDAPSRRSGGGTCRLGSHAAPVVPRQGCGGRPEGQQGRDRLEAAAPPPLLLATDEQRCEAGPRRTTSAPAPGTPPSLWALTLTRSAPSASRSVGTCPQAAAASTWTVTPKSRHKATASWTGWRVPTSWLAHWQCTSAGAAPVRAASACGGRRDRAGRCRPRRASRAAPAAPRRRGPPSARPPRTARAPREAALQAPHTAALIASVAPDVNTTWRGAAPSSPATSPARHLERVTDDAPLLVQSAGVGRRPTRPLRERRQRLGPRRCGAGVIEVDASHAGSGRGGAGVVAPGP